MGTSKSTHMSASDADQGGYEGSSPIAIPGSTSPRGTSEGSTTAWNSDAVTKYGSFVVSPPDGNVMMGPPSLELPDPALPPEEEAYAKHNRAWRNSRLRPNQHNSALQPSTHAEGKFGDAYEVGKRHSPHKVESSALLPKHRRIFQHGRTASTPGGMGAQHKPLIRRIFSHHGHGSPQGGDVPLEAYKEYDTRQMEYFGFLDKELDKIETFYKMKESQAAERLQLLREQLHEMRDRRIEEVRVEQQAKEKARLEHERHMSGHAHLPPHHRNGVHHRSVSAALRWIEPVERAIGVGPSRIGKVTKSLQQSASPFGPQAQYPPGSDRPESWRDFSRRMTGDDVPYRSAKRKLKLALQEFYRGLELLKSYALLNRTAFRKIGKKYDKTVKARPTGRYMSEKVNKAWFVQSEVLEGQLVAVEDLYARYFERGNHKIAVGKLRSKSTHAGDYSGSVFRNGLLIAGGLVFGIQGIVYGAEHLSNPDPVISLDASYLLQVCHRPSSSFSG